MESLIFKYRISPISRFLASPVYSLGRGKVETTVYALRQAQ